MHGNHSKQPEYSLIQLIRQSCDTVIDTQNCTIIFHASPAVGCCMYRLHTKGEVAKSLGNQA